MRKKTLCFLLLSLTVFSGSFLYKTQIVTLLKKIVQVEHASTDNKVADPQKEAFSPTEKKFLTIIKKPLYPLESIQFIKDYRKDIRNVLLNDFANEDRKSVV